MMAKMRVATSETSEIQRVEVEETNTINAGANNNSNSSSSSSSSTITRRISGSTGGVEKGITRPPLNFLAITKDAEQPVDTSCPQKLCEQLYAGVFLESKHNHRLRNTLKYFVDKNSNKNCFVLFARELDITWGDNNDYWKWEEYTTSAGEDIEVAKLAEVCWLAVKGQIETIYLSPGILYEIVFRIMMPNDGSSRYGGDHISNYVVKLSITSPRLEKVPREQSLKGMPLGEWFEIQVGEFRMSPENVGTVVFSLEELSTDWKRGLVIQCAIVRPKK